MIKQVIYDLKVFVFFYIILIILFSQIFAVLGVGNTSRDDGTLKQFKQDIESGEENEPENFPNEEYEKISLFFGYIFSTLRMSLGDFDFEAS